MSETFWIAIVAMGLGSLLVILAGIGYFVLTVLDKREAAGTLRIGKVIEVKGVSLVLLAGFGGAMGLGGLWAFDDVMTTPLAAEVVDEYDWGFIDEAWDEGREAEEDWEEMDGIWPADDDDSAEYEPIEMPDEVRRVIEEAMRAHYAGLDAGEALGPPEDLEYPELERELEYIGGTRTE